MKSIQLRDYDMNLRVMEITLKNTATELLGIIEMCQPYFTGREIYAQALQEVTRLQESKDFVLNLLEHLEAK